MLTQATDATLFKLQVYHQYMPSKSWLPQPLVSCGLKPTTQDPEVKCQSMNRFSEACQMCLHYFPKKLSRL